MAWTIDVLNLDGTTAQAAAPFHDFGASWALDGPGACEVTIGRNDMANYWENGTHRVLIKEGATSRFGGFLEHLSRTGGPDKELYRAAGLGLASVLGRRVVHGDQSYSATAATAIAWDLINDAQGQADGAMGFTLGSVTGTPTNRTRHYCDGDNIREAIDELAAFEPGGFAWEISATGAFNTWTGASADRGVASGQTLDTTLTQGGADTHLMLAEVESESSDLLTYVTALGEADEPCGAPLEIRSSALASTYRRREDTVGMDSNSSPELQALADQELKTRGRARRTLRASWLDRAGYRPWAFGAVWLGDTITATLESWFGGSQTMRCVSIEVSYEWAVDEPFVTMEFQAV